MRKLLENGMIHNEADTDLLLFMEDRFLPFAQSLVDNGYSKEAVIEGFTTAMTMWREHK